MQNALVTGATNQIGHFLVPRLQAAGFTVTAVSRDYRANSNSVTWQQLDLQTTDLSIQQPTVLFHIAPLPLLGRLLANLPPDVPLQRVITFSSTSRFTKANSPNPKEQAIAAQLAEAETLVIQQCQRRAIPWTLFRPTLVYGCGQDKNITFIANFIRRFGFFPILGEGTGLRQPVHADDLAMACIQALATLSTHNRDYNLSGGQTLNYRDMVAAIFHQLGKKPRIITIPLVLFNLLTYSVLWLPVFSHVTTAMVARMNQDLCFDHSAAFQDFGYQPRGFSHQGKRI